MKLVSRIVILSLALVGLAKADYEVYTDEQLEWIYDQGEFPAEFKEDDLPSQNLRKLSEPGSAGDGCGRNSPCKEGLDCLRIGFRRQCAPANCVNRAVQDFIVKNKLEDFPQEVMKATGYLGEDPVNASVVQAGWSTLRSRSPILKSDFSESVTKEMLARQPDLKGLLHSVLEACPEQSEQGVTIMIGLNYEIAALAKLYQNIYFAVGTGDFNLDIDPGTNGTVPGFGFNITAGLYSDCCGGAGLDAGFDLSLTFGAFLSGSSADLEQNSWQCDIDGGIGSVTGFAGGLTSDGIGKFWFSQGVGLGFTCGIATCCTSLQQDLTL